MIEESIYQNDNFTSVGISFGNLTFYLLLILPHEGMSVDEADNLLTYQEIQNMRSHPFRHDIYISLPSFKIEGRHDLSSIIAMSGLSLSDSFNTSKMFESEINGGIHSSQATSFEINEAGVKSAAVSDADLILASDMPSPGEPYNLIFNRPFYFFINEFSTQTCLLSGRVVDL